MRSQTHPSQASAPAKLRAASVSKAFQKAGKRVDAVLDVDLEVAEGEFIAIIGPSGCGKSTLFNIIAGLIIPDKGRIEVDGRDVTGHPEVCALMPQKDLLFPWRNVIDNTILGLQIAGMSKADARRKADPLFETFGIAGTQQLYPSQLSGGMKQRAALLRTVVQERPVLLLDEPFGALDALTRADMQDWLLGMWQRQKWTVILVTHDIREAVFLADRVYVMTPSPGRIQNVITIDLPRPRTPAIVEAPEFSALETMLTHELRQKTNL